MDGGASAPVDVRMPLLRSERNVLGLRAFCALGLFELDLRALSEGLVAIAADGAEMDEHVLATGVGGDEAIPLCIVEPLDGSGCHRKTPPLPSKLSLIHISEPTRRTPISYAVFCLKKKKNKTNKKTK